MIKFFRSIRQRLLSQNRFKKYLFYAIGEIILVMIGILLALQVNNWNEARKIKTNQTTILKGLVQSINNDFSIYTDIYDRRLEVKRKAIDTLIYFIGKNIKINDSVFMSYYNDIDNDIRVRYESGTYDALKSTGLNQILNDSLRERIVFIYDFFLPIYVRFSNEVAEYYDPIIGELESEIIESKVVRTTNNKFEIQDFPSIDNISQSTVLARILKLQQNKYNNYTSRLKDMRRFQENLKLQLQKELGQTQN